MDGPSLEITGVDELRHKLWSLNSALREQIGREAVAAGAEPMEAAIRGETPVGQTGNLRRSVTTAMRSYRRGEVTMAIVGPAAGPGWYTPFVVKGTGRRPANPFIERGFSLAAKRSESALINRLSASLEREATA